MNYYFTKIKNLVDSLEAAGKKISYGDHVMYILAGLGPEYDSSVSVITGSVEMPPLQRVYSLLLSHENRLQRRSLINSDGSLPSVNLKVQSNSRGSHSSSGFADINRRGRAMMGRFNRRSWNTNQKPQCQLCGRFGHTVMRRYYRFDKAFQGPNQSPFVGASSSTSG